MRLRVALVPERFSGVQLGPVLLMKLLEEVYRNLGWQVHTVKYVVLWKTRKVNARVPPRTISVSRASRPGYPRGANAETAIQENGAPGWGVAAGVVREKTHVSLNFDCLRHDRENSN